MKQRWKERRLCDIHWSSCAVLLAFCIKKAKHILKTKHKINKQEQKFHTIHQRDKLKKGLGVSLAKTPFELITPKADTLSQFFFIRAVLFCCVIVCYTEQSKITCSALVCVFCVDAVCFCFFVLVAQNIQMWSLVLHNGSSRRSNNNNEILVTRY